MSMIAYVLGLTPVQIAALRTTPSLAADVVKAAQYDASTAYRDEMLSRLPQEKRKQAEANRAEFDATPTQKQLRVLVDGSRERIKPIGPFEPALSLEKSWHILHYLFTGHIGPAKAPADLLLSGQPLGEDVGYGPSRLRGPTETRKCTCAECHRRAMAYCYGSPDREPPLTKTQ
jgi:hypothetical protein